MSLAYSDRTAFTNESSDFSIESIISSVEYSWPISEYSRIQFGGLYLDSQQITTLFSSNQNRQSQNRQGGGGENRRRNRYRKPPPKPETTLEKVLRIVTFGIPPTYFVLEL